MAFYITFQEVIDIIIMTLLIGWLFQDMFRPVTPQHHKTKEGQDEVLSQYGYYSKKPKKRRVLFSDHFWFAVAVVAPAIILHEMMHKFAALGFGLSATFHAFYADGTTLFLGIAAIFAKLIGFGFFFFVPGFVSIGSGGTPLQMALIALAGPFMHLVFWIASLIVLKRAKGLTPRQREFLWLTKRINMLLFIINMLPIPGIDGWSIYSNLWKAFGL